MLTLMPANYRYRFLFSSFPQALLFLQKPVLLLLLWQYGTITFAQGSEMQYVLDFKKTETTYYMITDTTRFYSGSELVKLRRQIKIDSVIREVDMGNDIMTTIYHLKDTQIEDWMAQPAKTIINKEKTTVYDNNQNEIVSSMHSETYIRNYDVLKKKLNEGNSDIIPQFTFVTQDMINSFLAAGFTFTDKGPEGLVFSLDTIDIIINNDEFTSEVLVYSKMGILLSSLKHGYMKDESAGFVPSFTISKTWDERFAGNCVRKVVVTDFDDYKITYGNRNRENGFANDGKIFIYPNPVDEQLNLLLPAGYFASATLEILDATGNILLSKYLPVVQQDLIVPVAALNTGFYVVRLFNNDKEINKTFYKN